MLLATTGSVAAVTLLVPYMGELSALLGFVELPTNILLSAITIVMTHVVATEIGKRWFYRKTTNKTDSRESSN
jgi:Mg2+-importing ATPase